MFGRRRRWLDQCQRIDRVSVSICNFNVITITLMLSNLNGRWRFPNRILTFLLYFARVQCYDTLLVEGLGRHLKSEGPVFESHGVTEPLAGLALKFVVV